MRVLVVLSHVPDPEGSAAGRCAVALLNGMRAHGLDVRAVAAHLGWDSPAARALADVPVEVVPVPERSPWEERRARVMQPRSLLARTPPLVERVREVAADVDVVYLDEVEAAPLGPLLPHDRTVTHLHCLAGRDRVERDLRRPAGRERLEHIRAERRAVRRCPHIVADSQEVAADLRGRGARDVHVVALALDPARYVPRAAMAAPVAGLIAVAGRPSTADAVHGLLREVWPAVRARVPGAILRLAGRGMEPARFGAAGGSDDGVEWIGEVASAEGFIRSLGLLLYPLGRGSGTKVKVLESLALGVPVVTTPQGAEGIAPGDALVVREGPMAVADAAATLLADPTRRAELAPVARAAFFARHSPAAAAEALVPVLERAAARSARGRR